VNNHGRRAPECSGKTVIGVSAFSNIAHQPGYEAFKALGQLNDYVYQALVHTSNAKWQLSWASKVLDGTRRVPDDVKERLLKITSELTELQVELRKYKKYGR
jgi:hypothetical protein